MSCRTYLLRLLIPFVIAGASVPAANAQDQALSVAPITQFLREQGRVPADYIIAKLKTHDLVMLGEDHWIHDHPAFVAELIRAIRKNQATRLDVLAIEFGNAADQKLADDLVAAPEWHEDWAFKILQGAPDTFGWPYQETLDVLRAVWEVNRQPSNQPPIRLLLLDPPGMQTYLDGGKVTIPGPDSDLGFHLNRDGYQAYLLEKHVFGEGKKGLFWVGSGHSRSIAWSSYDDETKTCFLKASTGLLMKTLHPDQVFTVKLWSPNTYRAWYPTANPKDWARYLDGRLDEAFRLNGDRPVGFDLSGSPLAALDRKTFFGIDTENEEAKKPACPVNAEANLPLSREFEGIVFLKSLSLYTGATLLQPRYFDEAFLKRISTRTDGTAKTPRQAYEEIKKGRPMLDASIRKRLDEIQKQDVRPKKQLAQ